MTKQCLPSVYGKFILYSFFFFLFVERKLLAVDYNNITIQVFFFN